MVDNNSPDDNVFDNISRLLASTMPRRQAVKTIAAMVGSATVASVWPSHAQGSQTPRAAVGMKAPVNNFSAQDEELYRIINILREKYHIPVSFIQSAHNPPLSFSITKGTPKDILNAIVKQNASYQWKIIRSRIIVFPTDSKYLQVVSGLSISNIARYKATNQYNDYLAAHVPGFDQLGGVTIYGSTNLPRYSTPVSLTPTATVIMHFVELLGNDPDAVLTIVQLPGEKFIATFYNVEQPKTISSRRLTSASNLIGLTSLGLRQGKSSNPIAKTQVATSRDQLQSTAPSDLRPALDVSPHSVSAVCRPYSISFGSYADACGTAACNCDPCPKADPNLCSVSNCYGIVSYSACTGDDCSQASLSEAGDVTTPGCGSAGVHTGSKCPTSGNNFVCCWDHYGPLQIRPQDFPNGCTMVSTQTFSMGANSSLLSRVITYQISVVNGQCGDTGGISTIDTTSHIASDCCGTGNSGSPKVLCNHDNQVCVVNDVCCDKGTAHSCNHVCCLPSSATYAGDICATDPNSGQSICCLSTKVAGGVCCPPGQATSDGKICCPSGQSPQGTICCLAGQTNCNGNCCASNVCCNKVCCAKGQTCIGGVCCGAPTPQARMSHAEILQGRYATDDLSQCCQPGQVPCVNACCDAGSVCCSGSCCAGTCDSSGTCITNNENK